MPPPSAERNGLTALALPLHQPALYVPARMCDHITTTWLGKGSGLQSQCVRTAIGAFSGPHYRPKLLLFAVSARFDGSP
jgi:hypothetical protein